MVKSVGAIGIDVRPEAGDFNKQVKEIARKASLNDVVLKVSLDSEGLKNDLRASLAEMQRMADTSTITIHVKIEIDDKALDIEVERVSRRRKPKVKVELEIDETGIQRDFERLNRNAEMVLRPDIKLDKRELKNLDAKLDVDIQIKKDRIQENLDRLEELKPNILSLDPKVNTPKARAEWNKLKRDLSGDTVDLKADLDRQGKVQTQLAVLTHNRVIDLTVRITKRSLASTQAALASLTGVNLLKSAALGLEGLVTNLDTLAFSMFKIGTGLSSVATGALGLTSSVTGLAGGLGQLGGFALAAPAAIVSLGAAFTVVKMAFSGFAKATSPAAAGSPAAMAKWLELLPPQAQAAAVALRGVWKNVQLPVQEAFWSKMGGAFEGFIAKVIPELKGGLIGVGKAAGHMGSQILAGFSSLGGKGIYSGLFGGLAASINQAAVGMRPLITGFMTLASEGAKALPDMGTAFRDMAEQFNSWVQRSVANGKITEWITNAQTAAKNLGRALIGIKGQFSALLTAAKAGGTGDLGTFADKMMAIRRTMESPIFQSTLANLFKGAHEAIGKMKDGLGKLGYALYNIAPQLRSIMTVTGGTIGSIFKALAESIQRPAFKEGLVSFFTGAQEGIQGLLKYLPKVADGIGSLADLLGTIAKNILPTVGKMFGGVADTFKELQPTLKALVPTLANFANNSLGLFLQFLNLLAMPMKIVLDFFNKLPGGVQTAVLALFLLNKYTSKGGLFGGFKKTVTDPVVRALKTDIPGAATASRNALSKPLGSGFMSAAAFKPALDTLRGIPGEAGKATGAVGKISGAFGRVASAGKSSMRGLFDFIGGGWGLAFAAGFAVMASVQEQSAKLEQVNKDVVQSYKDIAQAAVDAGQQIGGLASQKAALDRLNAVDAQKAQNTSPIGLGTNSTVGSLLKASGLGDQAFVDLMSGKGNDGAKAFVTGLRDQLESEKSRKSLGLPDWLMGSLPFNGDYTDMQASIDQLNGILDSGVKSKEEFDKMWSTDVGRADLIPKVLEGIRNASADGQVTIDNINGIATAVNGLKIDQADKPKQFANAIAQMMGGDTAHMSKNVDLITGSIVRFRNEGSKGNLTQFFVQDMMKADRPLKEIKAGLDAMGLSAEDQAHVIKFVWGPAVSSMGQPLTVLGEQIPKLTEMSTGVGEFSDALGAAAGINPDILKKIFTLDGLDLAKMARDLPAAGVGLDTIREALKAAGVTGPQLSADMALAAESASKLIKATGTNLGALTDFSAGLATLRDTAGDAAGNAKKLFDLLDKLHGGKVASGDITAGLFDQLRNLDKWGDLVDKKISPQMKALRQMLANSVKSGVVDFTIEGATDVSKQIQDLATGGIAAASDAFNTAINAGKTGLQAQAAATKAAKPMFDMLEKVRKEAGLTQGQWDVLLAHFNLKPDTVLDLVLTQTEGAKRELAEIKLKLDAVAPGVKIPVDMGGSAANELSQIGLKVTQLSDGKYEISLSADPATAKTQMAALQTYIKTQTPTNLPVTVNPKITLAPIGNVADKVATDVLSAVQGIFTAAPVTVGVYADINPAKAGIQVINSWGVEVDCGVDIDPAKAGIQQLNAQGVKVTVTPDVDPAVRGIQVLNSQGVEVSVGADAKAARAEIARLNGQTIWVQIAGTITGSLKKVFPWFHADGNYIGPGLQVRQYAGGGLENHQAQIASTLRIWGEPETGGEAYIPLAKAKRSRSLKILSDVAAEFGYQLSRATRKSLHFADGGNNTDITNASGNARVVINQHFPVTEKDSVALMRAGQLIAAM